MSATLRLIVDLPAEGIRREVLTEPDIFPNQFAMYFSQTGALVTRQDWYQLYKTWDQAERDHYSHVASEINRAARAGLARHGVSGVISHISCGRA